MDEVRRDVMRMINAGGTIFLSKEGKLIEEWENEKDLIDLVGEICEKKLTKRVSDNLMRLLTIAVGFKISVQRVGCPIFLQPRFLILAKESSLRVVAYGFVESTHGNIIGSGDPSTKYTNYICRAVSENIFDENRTSSSKSLEVSVTISEETGMKTTRSILKHDHTKGLNLLL